MNDVASLEPSKELYELSGWKNTVYWWRLHKPNGLSKLYTFDEMDHDRYRFRNGPETPRFNEENDFFPAYDLGYLLRKLPAAITPAVDNKKVAIKDMSTYFLFVQRTPDGYVASYNVIGNTLKFLYFKSADTPEDALCKLAIELFKQGVLTKEVV